MDRPTPPSFESELAEAIGLMEMIAGGPLMLDPSRFPIVVHESEPAPSVESRST